MNKSDAYKITLILSIVIIASNINFPKKFYSYKSKVDSGYEGRFTSLEECIKNETFAKAIQQESDYDIGISILNTTCQWR